MAGELHIEGKRKPDRKTDVYASGGLILTVMSGKPPFWGLRDSAILLRIIQNRTPKSEEHPELPPDDELWNLMRRCWDTDPNARPTMREVRREVR
ncbi:Ankyrin repeat and protein kinase domain-containing protein 1 [Tulasnella sp. UAMH 9824]|nr:Ankyrin repeat and protein kinase domain-containing protein 1 [Tulasnella sp. UAMH 9824]